MGDLTIKDFERMIMGLAKVKGFGTTKDEIVVSEKIALIHSEVSEAYDAYRKKRFEGKDCFKEELTDVLIRTIQLCAVFDIDIESELLKKLEYNKSRTWDKNKYNEKLN